MPTTTLTALGLLDDHARQCVMGAEADTTDELMAAMARLMRRG